MCEFCPNVGHCIVCNAVIPARSIGVNLGSPEGDYSVETYTVLKDGVLVTFDRLKDAVACLEANPQSHAAYDYGIPDVNYGQ